MTARRLLRRHVPAAAGCAALVVWWLWPLLGAMPTSVPGAGPGDNLSFVWNVWWTRYAMGHPGSSVFVSPMLLHPFGADLTLHTNTLLPAVAVSFIPNPVLAQNLLIAAHLLLNFVCAYALAWRETRHWIASIIAAIAFGWAPYVSAHLPGHFNLIAAWVLPLTALASLNACQTPTALRGARLGLVLGLVAYVDYYYFVYGAILATLLCLGSALALSRLDRPRARWESAIDRIFVAILAVDGLVVAWILATGGGDLRLAGIHVSAHGIGNPLAAAWLATLLWLALRALRSFQLRVEFAALRRQAVVVGTATLVIAVILSPLILHAVALWRSGDYTTQRYFWRSAPAGVDLATFVLGNPFNLIYGRAATMVYTALGVNLVEHVGWLGPALVMLTAIALSFCRTTASRWILPMIVFAAWSLGPYLQVAGHATTLWLPATLIRWIPIVSNARIPARAVIVVCLCCAVLSAHALAWLWSRPGFSRRFGAALAWLLVLDAVPRRPPLYPLPDASIYAAVRDGDTPGAVCELPLGIQDGFGEIGDFDARVLYYQTIHERPILGGFVARVPSSIGEQYRSMPIVGSLLRLSAGGPLDAEHPDADRGRAVAALASTGIRYVVVNVSTAPPDLMTYVQRVLPLRLLTRDDERAIYLVDPGVF